MNKDIPSLDELLREYNRIVSYIDEHDGEISPEVDQVLVQLESKLDERIDAYLYVINKLSHDVQYYDSLAEQFTKRAKRYSHTIDFLRDRVKGAMMNRHQFQVTGALFTASIRDGVPRVVIDNLDDVPLEFKRTETKVSPNKVAIREFLESQELTECEFARIERTPMLVVSTIKPKQ